MKKHRRPESSNLSEWVDTALIDVKTTRLSSVIFFLLCVMLILTTVAYGAVDFWAIGILSTGAGLIAIFWLADAFLNNSFRFSINPLQLPLIGIILIGLIQLLPLRDLGISKDLLAVSPVNSLSLDPNTTHLAIVNYSVYLVFFAALLTFIYNQGRLRKMVFVIIVFGSLMAFFGVIQSLSGSELIYGLRPASYGKPFASFVNRHHFAAFMEMTIGLTLSLLYGNSTKKDKRFLLIIAVILMGTGLILTGSRGGIISLFAVIGFVTIINFRNNAKDEFNENPQKSKSINKLLLIGGSLTLILVLIGSVLFIGGDSSLTRGLGLGTTSGFDNKADISTGRGHIWQTGLLIIRDNPIIGVGLDSFGTGFTKYDTENGIWRIEQAHNDYLQMLADGGILGFACVVAFIFLLYRQGLTLANQVSDRFHRGVILGSLAGCFGILIHSFFDFPLRTSSNALFFLTLAALATKSINYPKLYKKQ